MEVWVGPTTLGIELSTPQPRVSDCAVEEGFSPESAVRGVGFGLGIGRSEKVSVESEPSESSSSIGCPSGDDEDVSVDGESEEEVESKFGGRLGSLGSLGSLEESLPIKRGLSNYFTGKSKSFANLSDVSKVNDLEKQESPFNKRRRTLNAFKWARKSSFYSWSNPKSMPLLALSEEEDTEEKQEEIPKVHEEKFRTFKSSSCFSLADMQGQHA